VERFAIVRRRHFKIATTIADNHLIGASAGAELRLVLGAIHNRHGDTTKFELKN